MDTPISLGISPCPNDTFIFDALVHGKIPCPVTLTPTIKDVEELNGLVLVRRLDVSKISLAVLPRCMDDYVLLRSGGAMGRGCGPLVVARHQLTKDDLARARIAVPGMNTTATLLLRLFAPEAVNMIPMNFAAIVPAVARGETDCGVIIHETRFTYQEHGLVPVQDLGALWEMETGLPIPLGGIVARKSLGAGVISTIENAIRESVRFAMMHPEEPGAFIRVNAQETDERVVREHIRLYVNDYSLDMGDKGMGAVERLLELAGRAGHPSPRASRTCTPCGNSGILSN